MESLLTKFSSNLLSREQIKAVKGGQWFYDYQCECGAVVYSGGGTIDDYRRDAQNNCDAGTPVSCTFTDRYALPS